ncbi:MAG: rhomboid family intramembrane serine protease [Gemmataceae bacterium]
MGIYDREYYRREGPGFLAGLAEQGQVTIWLIGLNIACFLLQIMTTGAIDTEFGRGFRSAFTDWFVLSVPDVLQGQVWRLLTYAFLHDTASIWHILFNMLMLFWFGRQVEEALGSREYLVFYLLGAVLGGVAFTGATLLQLHAAGRALGASGAVTAVLVLAACYNPRQVIYLFFILPVPIWGFVVFSVAADALNLMGRRETGIATSAHLAGAAFGFLYFKLGWRLSSWGTDLSTWWKRRSQPRLRLYREEEDAPTPINVAAPAPRLLDDEHLEAQVDAILEKIQRVGMDGLSDSERQLLVRASEAIKRRRG